MHPTARRQVLALIRIQMRPWHVFRSKQSVGHRSLQEAISLRLPLNLCTTTLQTSHVSCHPVRLSVSIRISVRINLPAQTPQRQTHVATSHLVRLTVKVGKALCSPRRAHLGTSASSTGFGISCQVGRPTRCQLAEAIRHQQQPPHLHPSKLRSLAHYHPRQHGGINTPEQRLARRHGPLPRRSRRNPEDPRPPRRGVSGELYLL